jgi:ferritin-like protein
MGYEGIHEDRKDLSKKTLDWHRAAMSLKEELEAADWYNQRVDVTEDESLRKILEHNRDEEKEHAAMLIEWLRRNDEAFAHELKDYLFTEEEITDIEEG